MQEGSDIPLDRADTYQLMADEICVMRCRDEVFREWTSHVVPYFAVLVSERGIVGGKKKSGEAVQS